MHSSINSVPIEALPAISYKPMPSTPPEAACSRHVVVNKVPRSNRHLPDTVHEDTGATVGKPFAIEKNVCIAAGGTIICGITKGENSIVAVGSIVTKHLSEVVR